jgi:hypothetical protein
VSLLSYGPVGMITSRSWGLWDATRGWHQRAPRSDDCFAPCVATVLQFDLSVVPDPEIDRSLARGESVAVVQARARRELAVWLAGRGLEMAFHREVPVDSPRWIGVVGFEGSFQSHALVMSGGRVIWDPLVDWQRRALAATGGLIGGAHGEFARAVQPRGVRFFAASDVTWGFTFRCTR